MSWFFNAISVSFFILSGIFFLWQSNYGITMAMFGVSAFSAYLFLQHFEDNN